MLRSNNKQSGDHVVSPEEEKEGCVGKDLQKNVLNLEWKSDEVMEYQ